MDVHVDPYQQLHEGTLAVEADLVAADDVDELVLTVDGAADGIHASTLPVSTRGQQVSQHQQVRQVRVRVVLREEKR